MVHCRSMDLNEQMPRTMKTPVIQHLLERQRFLVCVDGHTAVLDYQLRGQAMAITHTGVPPAIANRGIAAQLTVAALDYAAAQQLQVRPLCSYAATYIRRHPQYHGLLATSFAP